MIHIIAYWYKSYLPIQIITNEYIAKHTYTYWYISIPTDTNHTYQYRWIQTSYVSIYIGLNLFVCMCLVLYMYCTVFVTREYWIANGRIISFLFLRIPSTMERVSFQSISWRFLVRASRPPVQVSCSHGPRRWHGMHTCHDWDPAGLLTRRKQALVALHSSHWDKTAVPARTRSARMGCAHFQYPRPTAPRASGWHRNHSSLDGCAQAVLLSSGHLWPAERVKLLKPSVLYQSWGMIWQSDHPIVYALCWIQ